MNIQLIIYLVLLLLLLAYLVFGKESVHVPSIKPFLITQFMIISIIWGTVLLIKYIIAL